jgi:broad specificity phosphatase PhoE
LNAHGIAQAHELANWFESKPVDFVYSSDLRRALNTAEIVSQAANAQLHVDRRLREIDQGEWEGMLFEEIRSRYTKLWQQRVQDPLSVAPPGGETVGQVRKRVVEVLTEILDQNPDGHVAIVSHGLALALVKVHINNLPIETVWDHIPDNATPEILDLEAR